MRERERERIDHTEGMRERYADGHTAGRQGCSNYAVVVVGR